MQHQVIHIHRSHRLVNNDSFKVSTSTHVEGDEKNLLVSGLILFSCFSKLIVIPIQCTTHPIFNLRWDRVESALKYFDALEPIIQ